MSALKLMDPYPDDDFRWVERCQVTKVHMMFGHVVRAAEVVLPEGDPDREFVTRLHGAIKRICDAVDERAIDAGVFE